MSGVDGVCVWYCGRFQGKEELRYRIGRGGLSV